MYFQTKKRQIGHFTRKIDNKGNQLKADICTCNTLVTSKTIGKMLRIKSLHLVFLFVLMVIATNIMGKSELKKIPDTGISGKSLKQLEATSFSDSISSGMSCILFYSEESDFCSKMEYNLTSIENEYDRKVRFLKLDIEKNPGKYGKYDISGVPSILFFKDGQEINRVMGVVPSSNLKMIFNRLK